MTYLAKPKLHHPGLPKNSLGYTRRDYEGAISTLCAGCGHDSIPEFVAAHDHVFVVEQNRDAQLRTLLIAEGMLSPEKLTPVLHYDGTPITARFIQGEIAQRLRAFNVVPMKKTVAGD